MTTASFTAVGKAADILVESGSTLSYSLSGTFVATMQLVFSTDGGVSWTILVTASATVNSSVIIESEGKRALVCWRCVAYTSGAAAASVSVGSIVFSQIPSTFIAQPVTRKSMSRIRQLSSNVTATAGTTAGSTWHVSAAADGPFTHVAPIFTSLESGTITITSCAVAALDAAGQASMPTGFPHSSATYNAVTFSGSASGTMPVRLAASQPSIYVGDLTKCQHLGADNNGKYWVAVRAYFAGTGYSYRAISSATGLSGSGGQNNFMGWAQISQNVDGITTPANFTTTSQTGTNQVISGFITLNDTGYGATLATFGDSTIAGVGSVSGCISGAGLSVYGMALTGKRISHMNGGMPGAIPSNYAAYARNVITQLGKYINFASYRVSSINEACNSQARLDAHWAECIAFVNTCHQYGVIPILETCTPQNLGSVGADAYRQTINARARAQTTWLCFDVDAVLSDPAAPYQYLSAYNSGDNSHPNLMGYQAVADLAITPILSQLITTIV
jgi:hypothetical protein